MNTTWLVILLHHRRYCLYHLGCGNGLLVNKIVSELCAWALCNLGSGHYKPKPTCLIISFYLTGWISVFSQSLVLHRLRVWFPLKEPSSCSSQSVFNVGKFTRRAEHSQPEAVTMLSSLPAMLEKNPHRSTSTIFYFWFIYLFFTLFFSFWKLLSEWEENIIHSQIFFIIWC